MPKTAPELGGGRTVSLGSDPMLLHPEAEKLIKNPSVELPFHNKLALGPWPNLLRCRHSSSRQIGGDQCLETTSCHNARWSHH